MENQTPTQTPNQNAAPQQLPNATAVLVLGIISIALCWCYGVIGITLGIIAIVMSGKSLALYNANPSAYSLSSFNNTKAGRTCAIIGLSVSAVYLVVIIIYLAIVGAALSTLPWDMMNH